MGTFLRLLPLPALVGGVYIALAYFLSSPGREVMKREVVSFALPSTASLPVTVSDVLVILALLLLYIEVMKATRTSRASIGDHLVSLIAFVGVLIAFILMPSVGTTPFLLIVIMCFIDVIAGFTIGISSARRDIEIERIPPR
jgi:hypothetical protein